jgi:hypothetical protein
MKFGKTGTFPKGQLNADDEGAIKIGIAYDPVDKVVRIDFGTPVTWLGLPPDEARELANILLKKAAEANQ